MSIHDTPLASGDLNAKADQAKEALLALQPNFRRCCSVSKARSSWR